jgi:hypothetical protein
VELRITPHFDGNKTTFDVEGIDSAGKTIAKKPPEGNMLPLTVNGTPIMCPVQLHPTRRDDNTVAVKVQVLFTRWLTLEESEAMLLLQGKSGQVQWGFTKISTSLMEYKQRTGYYPKSLAGLNEGAFPDSLDMQSLMQTLMKRYLYSAKQVGAPSNAQMQEYMKAQAKLQRGIMFVMQLPAEADAHYAGKGVFPGAADTPIFWYRPKDSKKYRVIYADLSVRDADKAPNVPNSQPMPGTASNTQPLLKMLNTPEAMPAAKGFHPKPVPSEPIRPSTPNVQPPLSAPNATSAPGASDPKK